MPKRKSLLFTQKDVAKAVLGKRVNPGHWFTSLHSGKIYLKQKNFPKGKARMQRVFLKKINARHSRAKAELVIREKLRKAGLPVSKSGIVEINGNIYLATEPFLRKGGTESRLFPINPTRGYAVPLFLKKLTVEKNASLIKQLASDTAKIFNLGISPAHFDFHGFYRKKDGSFTRVIMDTELLYDTKPSVHIWVGLSDPIERVWGSESKEFALFNKTFWANLDPKLAKEFQKQSTSFINEIKKKMRKIDEREKRFAQRKKT